MSYKPEVKVDGQFHSNNLVFASKTEAFDYAQDLFHRWTLCSDYRAVESDETPNHTYIMGRLEAITTVEG